MHHPISLATFCFVFSWQNKSTSYRHRHHYHHHHHQQQSNEEEHLITWFVAGALSKARRKQTFAPNASATGQRVLHRYGQRSKTAEGV